MILWLQVEGEAGTYSIDDNIVSVSFTSKKRGYEQINQFRNGAYISGSGQFSPGSLIIEKNWKKIGAGNIWNSTREDLLYYLTIPFYKKLYIYRVDSNGVETRARIVPSSIGSEKYNNYAVSEMNSFEFYFVDSYWEATTGASVQQTLTTTTLEIVPVTNDGVFETFPIITMVPTSTMSTFQVQLSEGYGFTITQTVTSGQTLVYNCADSTVTLNGNALTGVQTAGSTFALAPGSNSLYVYAQAGTITISYNERFA